MSEVTQFEEALKYFSSQDHKETVEDFATILRHECSPNEYWECIGAGSFKECYSINDPDVIVKFATNENETEREGEIITLAHEAGVEDFFLPTIFIPLQSKLPVHEIDPDDHGYYRTLSKENETDYTEYEWVGDEDWCLDCAIVQSRIARVVGHDGDVCYHDNIYDRNWKDRLGGISFDVIEKIGIYAMDWLEAAVKFYGVDKVVALADFIKQNNIYDLHYFNIGFLKDGRPVILDWLS